MASYLPPTLHNGVVNTTFNPDDFSASSSLYVNFPQAQGTVTFPNAIVSGLLTTGTLSATSGTIDNIQIRRPFSSQNNQAIGYNSLQNILSSGYDNFVFGSNTANGITSGNNNTIVGNAGFGSCPAVAGTTSIGSNNGVLLTTGSNNTFLGNNSGSTLTTGSNNTFVGYLANTNLGSWSTSTAIGSGATITGNNQVVLGASTETVVIPNQIGFNYTSLPTIASSSIGYIVDGTSSGSGGLTNAGVTVSTISNLPIGVYIFTFIVGYIAGSPSGQYGQLQIGTTATTGAEIQSLIFTQYNGSYQTVSGSICYNNLSVKNIYLNGSSSAASINFYNRKFQAIRIA